eukprot:g14734.t1
MKRRLHTLWDNESFQQSRQAQFDSEFALEEMNRTEGVLEGISASSVSLSHEDLERRWDPCTCGNREWCWEEHASSCELSPDNNRSSPSKKRRKARRTKKKSQAKQKDPKTGETPKKVLRAWWRGDRYISGKAPLWSDAYSHNAYSVDMPIYTEPTLSHSASLHTLSELVFDDNDQNAVPKYQHPAVASAIIMLRSLSFLSHLLMAADLNVLKGSLRAMK